jgi:hypothetical protein
LRNDLPLNGVVDGNWERHHAWEKGSGSADYLTTGRIAVGITERLEEGWDMRPS